MDLELTGKKAIVTGGSRGIGKAIVRQLALEGADVGIAARDKALLDATATELAAETGRRIVPWSCDTSDDDSVRAMVGGVAGALGGVDILVNCAAKVAGLTPPPKLAGITTDELWTEVNTKVMGYIRTAREVAPLMAGQGWGRIVNVAGLAARGTGSAIGSIRNVSVSALTKNLADELGTAGINVTCVHPGITRTERTDAAGAERGSRNSIGRIVDSEEVAYLVAFLASPKSAGINGDTIVCGGGTKGAIYY